MLWKRTTALTAASNLRAAAVRADSAGNSIVARVRKSRGVEGPFGYLEIAKHNSAGTVLWTRPLVGDGFGSSLCTALHVDGANNVLAMTAGSNAFTAPRAYLYKLNGSTGAVLWTKTDVPVGTFFAPPLDTDSSNNVFVGGTGLAPGDARMGVVKVNGANGATLWSATVARTAAGVSDILTSLDVDGQNNVAVAGYATASNGCGVGPKPMVLSRLRGTDGARLWTTTYTTAANAEASFPLCAADAAGNVYAASSFSRPGSGVQWALTKRNAANGGAAFNRIVSPPAGVFYSPIGSWALDLAGVTFGGDTFGLAGGAHQVFRYSTAGAALWNRSLPNLNSNAQYYAAGLQRSHAFRVGSYFWLRDTGTAGSRIVRLNPTNGNVVWNKTAGIAGDAGPVDLAVLPNGDPVVVQDTLSGTGFSAVENVAWRRIASATGNVAATNAGVNSVVPTCDLGGKLLIDPAGNLFALGGSAGKILVQRLTSAGAVQWQRLVEATDASASSLDSGGEAIVRDGLGNIYGAGKSRNRKVVFKLNGATGGVVWAKQDYGYTGRNLAVNASNELYVPGSPPNSLRKLDAAGNSAWTGIVNGSLLNDTVQYVAIGPGNVPFVAGTTSTPRGCPNPANEKVVVARLDPATGGVTWLREIAPLVVGEVDPVGIVVDPTGHIVVAGTMASSTGGTDYFASRLDATTGAVLWTRRYDRGSRPQVAGAFTLDSNGDLGITGQSFEAAGPAVWTLKAALGTGAAVWNQLTATPAGNKRADWIGADNQRSFYVTGVAGDATRTRHFGTKHLGTSGNVAWQYVAQDGLEAFDFPVGGAMGSGRNLHLFRPSQATGVGLAQATVEKLSP